MGTCRGAAAAHDVDSPRGRVAAPPRPRRWIVRGDGVRQISNTRRYADHVATAGRSKQALPTYFRKEAHTAAFYDGFLANERLRELVGCLLATNDLRLYPVYMARGKVPDALSLGAHTVDWHQDAEYTYYWYSRPSGGGACFAMPFERTAPALQRCKMVVSP